MKVAKVTDVVKIYSLQCPYCGGEVANEYSGSLDHYLNDSNGQTGVCTNCNEQVRLPKMLRSNQEVNR